MMLRDLQGLGREFDVLIIGGGAAGAAAAREACLRGFSTALIEREDFGSGTSAHCYKVVHGGIRYLQHADLRRVRASCRERAVLLRIAPHLVSPLPFAIPTYGRGRSGRGLLRAGTMVYDLLTADCNAHVLDPSRRIGRARVMDRTELLRLFPEVDRAGLTGAVVFEDGQMHNPPRLVLAFVAAAAERGAVVANYVEAERLLIDGHRVKGVVAHDRLSGDRFEIRARVVINAAGPWAESLLEPLQGPRVVSGTYSRDACFIVSRRRTVRMGLALRGGTRDADAVIARGGRHLLLAPWRNQTLIGVWHAVVPRDPDTTRLTADEIGRFVDELNRSCERLQLDVAEVRMADFGLVPFGAASAQQPGRFSFGKQSLIVDHREQGIQGLVSMISVRFTVARADAVAALALAGDQLGRPAAAAAESAIQPLPGGDIEDYERFARELRAGAPQWMPATTVASLACNFGTRARRVMALAEREPSLARCVAGSDVTFAELAHAVREEMAQRMTDVVFRRTDLGTAGHPGEVAMAEVEGFLRRECRWTAARAAEERALVERHFARYLATTARPLAARSA